MQSLVAASAALVAALKNQAVMHAARRVACKLTRASVEFVLREDKERFYADEAAIAPLLYARCNNFSLLRFGIH